MKFELTSNYQKELYNNVGMDTLEDCVEIGKKYFGDFGYIIEDGKITGIERGTI